MLRATTTNPLLYLMAAADTKIALPEDALMETYNNEPDEFSTIKNICVSDAAVGNIIFQVQKY